MKEQARDTTDPTKFLVDKSVLKPEVLKNSDLAEYKRKERAKKNQAYQESRASEDVPLQLDDLMQ